jgi:type II secretory pathway pseudopilin PulG
MIAWHTETQDLAATWDDFLGTIERFLPEDQLAVMQAEMKKMDEELGLSFRDDLLALVGPAFGGSVDLPPIDTIAGMFMAGQAQGVQLATSRIGVVMQVRDRERLNRSLQHLFELGGGEIRQEAELMRVTFKPDPDEPELEINAYFGFKGDFIAVAMGPDWVRSALRGQPEGRRLGDGADYTEVLSALDSDPEFVAYVNLPRLQETLRTSQMFQGFVASDPETAPVAEVMLDPEFAKTGMGYSTKRVGNGVRRTTFGPGWMGGAMQTGIIAAIAIPNLQSAIEKGRQKRTMADMRTLGTCMEAYAVDNEVYPSTGGEWKDISVMEEFFSPVYLNSMPAADGWTRTYRVKSTERDYWIVSMGGDGEIATDWSTVTEGQDSTEENDDLVYSNGAFLSRPTESDLQ